MTDFTPQNMHEALAAHLQAVKESNETVLKKTQSFFDASEIKNQELVKKLEAEKVERLKFADEAKAREAILSRPNFDVKSEEGKEEIKAFDNFLRKGHDEVSKKYLRTDSLPEGGALVPEAFSNNITKKIIEISNYDKVINFIRVGAKTTRLPIRNTLLTARMVGEGKAGTASNSTYGEQLLTLKKMTVPVTVTQEEIDDAGVSIADQIQQDVAEAFAVLLGQQITSGNGSPTQLQGYMASGIITQEINSGISDAITWKSMTLLTGQLKTGYNPIYAFNRLTRATLLAQEDGVGRPLWQPGNLAAGIPNTINGYAYLEIPDLADIAAGNYPVVFADFARGYAAGYGMEMQVIRDNVTLAEEGKVKYVFTKRVAGLVKLPEAFAKLKISA
jgi:HK97 family phage major capsid protein